jgi:hypothetical protein
VEKESWSNYSVTTKGSPTNYSFNQTNEGRTSSTTTKYHAWTNNTIGEGAQRHSKAVTTNSYFNQHIYDTLQADRAGDFGFGWSLGMGYDPRVRETVAVSDEDRFGASTSTASRRARTCM